MSFNTLRPEFSIDTNLLVYGSAYSRYSSANQELSQHVDYNVGSEKLAWRGSFSYNRYGDLRMGSQGSDELLRPYTVQRIDSQDVVIRNTDPTLQLNTGFEQFHTLQKLRYRPSNHLDFEYSFMYSRTGDYDRYDRLIRTRGGLPRAAEWYYGPQVWAMNKFEVNYRKSNLLFDGATLRIASQVFKESRHDTMINARPNLGHLALAELEQRGQLSSVITQNIDNLHFVAGSRRVLELHGNTTRFFCIQCKKAYSIEDAWDMVHEQIPVKCDKCDGIVRADVVMFGEMLPPDVVVQAEEEVDNCDLMLMIGSSLVVYPAAHMPYQAKMRGAKVIIINIDPTPMDACADLVLHKPSAKLLAQAVWT